MAKRIMARQVVEKLRGKVDPELLEVLVGLAEYQSEQRQMIQELAELTNRCVDQVTDMVRVAGAFKTQLVKFERHLPKGLQSEEVGDDE